MQRLLSLQFRRQVKVDDHVFTGFLPVMFRGPNLHHTASKLKSVAVILEAIRGMHAPNALKEFSMRAVTDRTANRLAQGQRDSIRDLLCGAKNDKVVHVASCLDR